MRQTSVATHERRTRTTLDLPIRLRERIKVAIDQGMARSQNALIVQAVEDYLRRLEEAWIDEQFAQMAEDEEYQALQLRITQEFATADWEALQLGEEQP